MGATRSIRFQLCGAVKPNRSGSTRTDLSRLTRPKPTQTDSNRLKPNQSAQILRSFGLSLEFSWSRWWGSAGFFTAAGLFNFDFGFLFVVTFDFGMDLRISTSRASIIGSWIYVSSFGFFLAWNLQ
ncbi:hypothetical protein C1645_482575 [Glomus cerebriforme]|uniref:Uncharacterized protein n=1 Tax=Glomus cerebriforme TaxID=658196 RepID=A0A397SDS0_9GLOM|nr:hypothetical protein C1645_482575 [Glomus cerebriforme]